MSAGNIHFAPGTFERLRRSAEARSRILNEDTRITLKKTSLKVLVALRATTRQSPLKRQVEKTPTSFSEPLVERSSRMLGHIKDSYRVHGTAKKPSGRHPPSYIPQHLRGGYLFSAVKSRKPGERIMIPIPGATKKTEANQSKKRLIQKRGLAKASFTWMMGKLGSGGASLHSEIHGATEVIRDARHIGGGWLLSVHLSNRLNYIMAALQGGKSDVSTALARGREMLMSDTRRALKRMARK